MMKIAHVITRLNRSGAEENTVATCNRQVERGHEVTLVYGRDMSFGMLAAIDPRVDRVQEPALIRSVQFTSDLRALRGLTRLFRDRCYEAVHTHTSKAGILGRMAARRAGVPIILHGVHILPFLNVGAAEKAVYLFLERRVAQYTDAFIAVSKGMAEANLAAGLGSAETNHIVYSGMDIARFQAAAPPADRPEGRLIVLVGLLEPRKRQWEFLHVFAVLAGRHPDLRLCLVGEGEEEARLRTKAADLGLSERIHFLGYRSDVEAWMAAAEICVLPSMREGLPRVVIQYVAAGKPVVVTGVPGIEEVVTNGENGFVVASGRVEEMEAPLERLLCDPALARRMAEAARSRDLSRWSVDLMEEKIEAILQAMARRKA